MSNFRRSSNLPKGYSNELSGVTQYNKVYIGFVKSTSDLKRTGCIQVFIPELSGAPENESGYFTVAYCSPMAGATPVALAGQTNKSQISYGWWAIPPDVENEAVVMFVNGDPNHGIFVGFLYQQFMNHMVPGIPNGKSAEYGPDNAEPPVQEYNKKDLAQASSDDPLRPRFEPLHNGLMNQGLYTDPIRGTSTSGARRADRPDVSGYLSPGGSQMVFDDDDENQFIRFRTKSGTQVMISETVGMIYMITKNGNSWVEISDDGIDMFTTKSYSVRAHGDINLHADKNINMYAGGGINGTAGGNVSLAARSSLDLIGANNLRVTSGASINLNAKADLNFSSSGDTSINCGGVMATKSGGVLSMNSGGVMYMRAPTIQNNNGSGPQPKNAAEAQTANITERSDREVRASGGAELQTKTIVSRMPTHEPFSGHPTASTTASTVAVNLGTSTRVQTDGSAAVTPPAPSDIKEGEDVVQESDDGQFFIPSSGRISSVYGPRTAPTAGASTFHQGVDIAAPIGTGVLATKAGKVTIAGVQSGYGNVIYLDHGGGVTSRYGHLSAFSVKVGDQVIQGQKIGSMGNSGISSGPHLHFEIRKGGTAINPATEISPLGNKNSQVAAGAWRPTSNMLATNRSTSTNNPSNPPEVT